MNNQFIVKVKTYIKTKKYISDWNDLIENIDNFIEWDKLKKVRNGKFISSMYIWLFLVPMLKKFLLKIGVHESPFSWDAFFYSAFFFVIGNIIFSMCSPKFIQLYNDYSEYETSRRNLDYLKKILESDFKSEYGNTKKSNIVNNTEKKEENSIFYDDYNQVKKFKIKTRRFCAFAYAMGFSFFTWVIIQNFIWMITNS